MRTGDDTCNLHEVKLLLIMWTNCTVRYSPWRCLMAHRNGVFQRNSAVSIEKYLAVFSLGYVKFMSEEMFRKDRGPVRFSCPRKSQPYYKKNFKENVQLHDTVTVPYCATISRFWIPCKGMSKMLTNKN